MVYIIEFTTWFIENVYANIFTLFTVLLSALVSWLISAIYHKKSNRINVEMSVILPIIGILEEKVMVGKYKELENISKEYSVRYLKKDERKALHNILTSYKVVDNYDSTFVNSEILAKHFENILQEYGIEYNCCPEEIDGEIVFYNHPYDLYYLSPDIEKVLKEIPIGIDECEAKVNELMIYYGKKYYNADIKNFFKNEKIEKVIRHSEVTKQWDKKFEQAQQAKQNFLNLETVQKVKINNI